MAEKRLKILVAKLGLDSHWRGAMVVTRALRDAGMEVIYLGNQFPDAIVRTALQEDVDVIGLSSLSGNHLVLAPRVVQELERSGARRMPVILGGAVPKRDSKALTKAGVKAVFGPGTPLEDIVSYVRSLV
ncbi:MAG: cobalamin B12-binding domain-containing protein [Chloroflexota bacterium]